MRTALFLLLFLPAIVLADIAVTLPSEETRDSSNGVSSFGRWKGDGGFQITWHITNEKEGYSYIYTIDGKGRDNASTFILQLNPDITPENVSTLITDSSVPIVAAAVTFKPGSAYAGLPGEIYGIQFATSSKDATTISFTSAYAPVWGSFYADAGSKSSSYAYNEAFGSSPKAGSKDFSNWVPTVGGAPGVIAPEPSTMLLLGSALVAVGYWQHKKRKAQKV